MAIRIGTAGWSIPRASAERVPGEGTHLQRYARVFRAAEINSSFHRPHAQATYRKWALATPTSFRFAVKVPRAITHEGGLRDSGELLHRFLDESAGLGTRRGPLLIQLPPKFAFDATVVGTFLDVLHKAYSGRIVCEPRHPTWFTEAVDIFLDERQIARVAADPPPVPGADHPGGWSGLVYYRLHGTPRKYWSKYESPFVTALAAALRGVPRQADAWCIFDNTASGAALENALDLQEASVDEGRPGR